MCGWDFLRRKGHSVYITNYHSSIKNKQYFKKLLRKYLSGSTTKEEQHFVERYYDLFQNEPDVWELLSAEEKQKLEQEIETGIWNSVVQQKNVYKGFFSRKNFATTAAAAAIIGLIIVSAILLKTNKPVKHEEPSVIMVEQKKENHIIFLPDGSTVILSPESILNYPSSFEAHSKREVFLEGQAFFDIKHNPAKPFIVHTGNIQTRVLGTAFNIKAFKGARDVTVTVKRGKVKVSDEYKTLGVITPNQQITYNKEKVVADFTTVTNENYLQWKEQDLLFDNLTIAEAAVLLEEKYKVSIKVEGQFISTKRFTTTFKKGDDFEQALKSICVFNDVVYRYNKEKRTVIISSK